ncbi:MAG: hypothetical protein Q8P57_00045 [Candidatus Pacearchaeota archaeon]|nr:hypothetical protein [Candidatus Pacearchaeota archaeon]
MKSKQDYIWALLRISLGLIFLWAFFDKLIGLGFSTCLNAETNAVDVMCDSSWLNGGSPTTGFLKFGTQGPFAFIFQALAGNVLIDWLFMLGLLGIGFSLILGIAVRLSGVFGIILLGLMWLAGLPPEHHPFLDEHIIYSLVLLGVIYSNAGRVLGLGNWWGNLKFVKRNRWLE